MGKYRDVLRDEAFEIEEADIGNEIYTAGGVDKILDLIETDINSILRKIKPIQGISEIDDLRFDLEELVGKLY